jgi:5'-methylthioadenosine phosphorylase
MGRLAVIGGTGVRDSALARDASPFAVAGVELLDAGDFVFLQRHGLETYIRAHEIDHAANVRALAAAGCDRVLALSSTGSLRLDWPVGTVVCPDDFYAPHVNPSLYDDGRSHTIPGFDPAWRAALVDAWRAHAGSPIVDGGVYTQSRGPRFETPAEVRALAAIGDLVGMTIAAECILTKEAGLPYAAVCVVDNLANGLDDAPLTVQQFAAAVAANQAALLRDLERVLPVLAKAER